MSDIKDKLQNHIIENIKPLEDYLDRCSEKFGYDIKSDQNILFKKIEDSIDLIKGVYIDSYMYEFSMLNYNNPELFMGNYYVDYSLVKVDILVERFVKCISIVYQVEFDKVPSRNTTRALHKKILNSNHVPATIKSMVKRVIKQAWKKSSIKSIRNQNEHDLSSHLEDSFKREDLKGNYYLSYDHDGIPYIENDVQKEFEVEVNRLVRENKKEELNEVLELVPKIEEIFREIMESILKLDNLNEIEVPNDYKGLDNDFNDIEEYLNNIDDTRNFVIEFDNHFEEMKKIRTIVNYLSDQISRNPRLVFKRPPTLQIIKYNTDSVYRTIELIRSLLNSLIAENEGFSILVDFEITNSSYYFNYALLRLYSCIEKIGKLLYTRFELDDYMGNRLDMRNKYIEVVLNTAEDEKMGSIYPVHNLARIIRSDSFERYRKHRNFSYHLIRPEFLLDHNGRYDFYIYMLAIMSDILNDVVVFFNNFEDGEVSTLAVHKLLRESGL